MNDGWHIMVGDDVCMYIQLTIHERQNLLLLWLNHDAFALTLVSWDEKCNIKVSQDFFFDVETLRHITKEIDDDLCAIVNKLDGCWTMNVLNFIYIYNSIVRGVFFDGIVLRFIMSSLFILFLLYEHCHFLLRVIIK